MTQKTNNEIADIDQLSWQDESQKEENFSQYEGEIGNAEDWQQEEDVDGRQQVEQDFTETEIHDDEYPSAAPAPAGSPLYKKKWFICLVVGVFVVSGIGYGFYKANTRRNANRVIPDSAFVPSLPPEQVPAQAPIDPDPVFQEEVSPAPEVVPSQPELTAQPVVNTGNESVADLKKQFEEKLAEIQKQIEANERKHREEYLKIAGQIGRLKATTTVAAATPRKGDSVEPERDPEPAQNQKMKGFHLQAVIPGQAWIVLPDGKVRVVGVGDILAGNIHVEKIMANDQKVITNKGEIF